MKFLTIAFVAAFSFGALADKGMENLPFEQQKQMKLQKLDQKNALITEARSCVTAAKDKTALNACTAKMDKEKKALEEDWKNKKKQAEESVEEGILE